jgi:hypothetical protein
MNSGWAPRNAPEGDQQQEFISHKPMILAEREGFEPSKGF